MTTKTKQYKVELKSLKIMQSLSEETLCFSASVYVECKRVGEASNRGQGGCTDYRFDDRDLQRAVEAWAKTLPPKSFVMSDGKTFSYDMNLEHVIDDLTQVEDQKRFDKKEATRLARTLKTKTHIRVVGTSYETGATEEWSLPMTNPRMKPHLDKTYGADGYVLITTVDQLHTAQKGD